MPWYAWLIIAVAAGLFVGNLLALRKSATKVDLTPEQLARIAERNRQMDAEEEREKNQAD